MTEYSFASSPTLPESPYGQLIDPHLLAFVLTNDEARADEILTKLLDQHALPIIARVVGRGCETEGLRREIRARILVLLREFKTVPTIKPIANFSHYVALIATNICRAEQPRLSPLPAFLTAGDAVFGAALLAIFWREIERMPPLQRLAYLLNFVEGNIEWFWFYGVTSIRQIGKTLQLTNEQFNRLWVLLEWNAEPRERARSLTNYDEKFALLWQQLPLNDLTIAALLETTQQNVLNIRQAARQRLRQTMCNALAISLPHSHQ